MAIKYAKRDFWRQLQVQLWAIQVKYNENN